MFRGEVELVCLWTEVFIGDILFSRIYASFFV